MRKRKSGRKFGREKDQRNALMTHLAGALIANGKIRTTEAKARELRPYVERLITKARKGNLATRRDLGRSLTPKQVKVLVDDIAPKFTSRPGGYTRIIKLPSRKSDGAKQAIIELL